ncbi:MAG: hypothetical protein ACT4QG_01880 [Sporichthyaceae bacterium]
MRALQLGAATGIASVLIAGSLLGPAMGASSNGAMDDLRVSLTAATYTPSTNQPAVITVRVEEVGTAASTARTLAVNMPASFTFVSLTQPTSPPNTLVTCGTPAVGATGPISCAVPAALMAPVVLVLSAQPTAVGPATASAKLTPADGDPADDEASLALNVVGPPGSGAVDPGYPDFPSGKGFGYGKYGYGYGDYGYGDYDDYYGYGYGDYGYGYDDYCSYSCY